MYIRFLEFKKKGSEVGLCETERQRENERDLYSVCESSKPPYTPLYTKWTSLSASLFGKPTQAHNASSRPTIATLSVSLCVSGSVSLTLEVVVTGPESHDSHT